MCFKKVDILFGLGLWNFLNFPLQLSCLERFWCAFGLYRDAWLALHLLRSLEVALHVFCLGDWKLVIQSQKDGMAYGLYLVLKAFNLILSSLFFIMLGLPVLSNLLSPRMQ